MFVAREKEIQTIKDFVSKKGAMVVYGLRRVGKTTLIKRALEDSKRDYVYFECQKTDEKTNVDLFVDLLVESIGFVRASFDSFLAVFKELDRLYADHVFVIDEYSYLKEYYLESKKPETKAYSQKIDSEFQVIVDNHLQRNNLILSGSSIHIMESLLEHRSPLYGRFMAEIDLRQFIYLDAIKMFPHISLNDFIAFYSVFGGSPYVLSMLDENKSLKENICSLLLNPNGRLQMHLRNNIVNELEGDSDLHNVLNAIKNGTKKYGEIQALCHIETSGLLDKKLKKLLDLGIVEEQYPIGKDQDRRKKRYAIYDNLLKFYYAYIFRQDNRIDFLGQERYYDVYIAPSIKEFISRRFESIVRDYFSIAVKNGKYPSIIDIGSYFYADGEFDCVFQKDDETYGVYEVKYWARPMKHHEMAMEIAQIKAIPDLPVSEIGFVCSAGYETRLEGVNYLDLEDIFFTK